MDFQYKRFKTFLSIILIIIASNSFASETERPVLHEITIESSSLISVKIYTPKYIQKSCIFSFNNSSPNYYLEENNIKNIQNLKVVLNNGETITHEAAVNIKIEDDFEFIEYQYAIEALNDNSFLPIKNLLENNLFLNFSSFLGSFNTDTLNEIRVKVFKDRKKIYGESNQFNYFINKPLCLCSNFDLELEKNLISIQTNDTSFVSFKTIQRLVTESFSALSNHMFIDSIKNRKMIFLFDDISQNTGAIARKDNIVFHFNTDDTYVIQKTIIHEILHWIVPSQQNWLNEAVPEYLAIKTMLQEGLISKEKFLKVMSNKIKLADAYSDISLNNIYNSNSQYKAIYSKGTIHAWLLDLAILNKTNYQFSLEQYVLELNRLSKEMVQNIIQEFIFFDKIYIVENKALRLNASLSQIGVLFERYKLKEIKEKQKIVFNLKEDKLTITDPASLSCLQKDDIIYSLDGKREIQAIYEKLNSLSNKNSRLTILRDSKKLRFILNNEKSIMQKLSFNLAFITAPNDVQKINWFKFAAQTK